MNRPLKAEIVYHFGSQTEAAQALGIEESRLSRIIHGRVSASDKEKRAFARVFGSERVESLLKGEEVSA
jgi:plasmid maintenance system antidote protein VapI